MSVIATRSREALANAATGTLENSNDEIPTVVDSAFKQGLIDDQVISVYFQPTTKEEDQNGELIWGGVDDSKHTGDIKYTYVSFPILLPLSL